MKKVIRLTESDLTRIVKRILKEDIESTPKSITIKLTKKWQQKMRELKDEGVEGHLPLGSDEIKLIPGMWHMIGLGPYEMKRKRSFFYASYSPENNEVYVHKVSCKGESIGRVERERTITPNYIDKVHPDTGTISGCVRGGGFYSKFDDGMGGHRFKVGELDDRHYFEIVDVEK